MRVSSRFLAIGAALALAACSGSDPSPVAPTAAVPSVGEQAPTDGGLATDSGNGPGRPVSPAPGAGTCTHDCDGTSQGPGPGAGGGYGPGPGPGGGLCGNACTGPVGPDPADIVTLLGDALQEEYRVEMLYRSVLEDYPGASPFAAIVESESRHVAALQMLFTRRQQAPPASTWTPGSFDPFLSIQVACAGGVDAETEDAAFYSVRLQRADLPQDVRNVFTNLQAAALENHLPAFARCQ